MAAVRVVSHAAVRLASEMDAFDAMNTLLQPWGFWSAQGFRLASFLEESFLLALITQEKSIPLLGITTWVKVAID